MRSSSTAGREAATLLFDLHSTLCPGCYMGLVSPHPVSELDCLLHTFSPFTRGPRAWDNTCSLWALKMYMPVPQRPPMLPAEAHSWLLLDSASWASSMTQHPRLAALTTAAGGMTKDPLTMGGRGLLIVHSSPTSVHWAADPSPRPGLWPLPTLLPPCAPVL